MTSISRVTSLGHEEIDLGAIMYSVWRQKSLVAAVAIFMGAMAGAYAYVVTPQYQVSTLLRPAALNDLDALNRTQVYTLPPVEALNRVGAALESYDTRLNYFRSNPALSAAFDQAGRTQEQAFDEFNNKALSMVHSDPKKTQVLNSFLGLEMRYPEGVRGDEILNGFVKFAIESERQQIAADLKVIVTNRMSEIDAKLQAARAAYDLDKQGQIALLLEADNLKRAELQDELLALRVQLKAHRDSRISQLNEAIKIAHSLGLKKPSTPSAMASNELNGTTIRTEVNSQQNPLYFMGSDALEAERLVLKQRTSDDFSDSRVAQIHKELQLLKDNRKVQVLNQRQNEDVYLKGIEALRAERLRLSGINTDMSHLSLVSIDRQAIPPLKPIKPNKLIVVVLGLLVGVGVGVLMAIVRYGILSRRLNLSGIKRDLSHGLPSDSIAVEGLAKERH